MWGTSSINRLANKSLDSLKIDDMEELVCQTYLCVWCSRWDGTGLSPQSFRKCVSLRKQPAFRDATTGFSTKWRLKNEHRNSVLMKGHYRDLGSASDWSCSDKNLLQPVMTSTGIWVVTCHQYWISVVVAQASFCGEKSGEVVRFISLFCFVLFFFFGVCVWWRGGGRNTLRHSKLFW